MFAYNKYRKHPLFYGYFIILESFELRKEEAAFDLSIFV